MSLTYGNNVRIYTPNVRVSRIYTPYFFAYPALVRGIATVPTTLVGYPNEFINEKLDFDSELTIRTLVADSETFDLSGVAIRVELQTYRMGVSTVTNDIIATIRLDDLGSTSSFGERVWQVREKVVLKDVITNFDSSDIAHMYVILRLSEKDLSTEIGNEWGLSLLLNSPAP